MSAAKPPKLDDKPFVTIRERLYLERSWSHLAFVGMFFSYVLLIAVLKSRQASDWIVGPIFLLAVATMGAVQLFMQWRLMRCPCCGTRLAKYLSRNLFRAELNYCPHCAASFDEECPP